MKKRKNSIIMFRLIKLVKPLALTMLIAIIMGVFGHLAASFITIFAGLGVLSVLNQSQSLTMLFMGMILCALIRGFLRYAEQSCNHYIAFKLLALIRDEVFGALRKLAPSKLDGKDKGDLIAVITSDIELLEVFYAHTISPIVIAICYSIFMICFIGRIHPFLGLCALLAYLCIGACLPLIISSLNKDNGLKFRMLSGELSGFLLEAIRGLNETIQYHMGEKFVKKMNQKNEELFEVDRSMKKTTGFCTALSNALIWGFNLIMFISAFVLFQKGQISFEGMLLACLSLMSSFGPVSALASLGSTLQNTMAAGNRVLDILDETPIIEEVTDGKEIKFESIECEHVDFSYQSELILKDCSLHVEKESIIGISGKSGCGKSTLLKLLMRFYDPSQGEVKISNESLKGINSSCLRNTESFMMQDTHLFYGSIFENLRIAKWDASYEEVEEACKKASIHEFVMNLPHGYDTMVAELGESLSGGERQRISLARAFLHQAPLLLLDEPTSNLDSLNEAVILKSLDEERKGKTVILVSHRESTMKIADQVYEMSDLCAPMDRVS